MKSIIFIIFSLGLLSSSNAQQQDSYPFFNNMRGKRIVVADTAILHVGPSAGAAHTDTLFFGEEINVLMPVPYFEQVQELDVPWLKITYFKKGFTRVSYILAHEVSLTTIIEKESKLWTTSLKQQLKNEKIIQVFSIKNKQIVNTLNTSVPLEFTVDSIELEIAEKPCLQEASLMFTLNLKSNSPEKGVYKKWFVLCSSTKFISLPYTHIYYNTKLKAQVQERLIFSSQSSFKLQTTILTKKVKETVVKYKWQDCNYINL